jgi:hypothetical protein
LVHFLSVLVYCAKKNLATLYVYNLGQNGSQFFSKFTAHTCIRLIDGLRKFWAGIHRAFFCVLFAFLSGINWWTI